MEGMWRGYGGDVDGEMEGRWIRIQMDSGGRLGERSREWTGVDRRAVWRDGEKGIAWSGGGGAGDSRISWSGRWRTVSRSEKGGLVGVEKGRSEGVEEGSAGGDAGIEWRGSGAAGDWRGGLREWLRAGCE
jgi:hypothetical protein